MTVKTSPVNVEDRKNLDLRVGDRVRVWQKITEKGKTRLQPFEGLVLSRKHGTEAGATFTVRRVSQGIGIERIIPLYSPNIDKIEVLRRSKVRRAKLYYIREKVAKQVRRKLRRSQDVHISTESEAARAQREVEAEEAEANADQQEEGEPPQQDSSEEPQEEETSGSEENSSASEVTQESEDSDSQSESEEQPFEEEGQKK